MVNQKMTYHEMIMINEALRLEAACVQKAEAMLPVAVDPGVRQELQACIQLGRIHIGALMGLCGEAQTF